MRAISNHLLHHPPGEAPWQSPRDIVIVVSAGSAALMPARSTGLCWRAFTRSGRQSINRIMSAGAGTMKSRGFCWRIWAKYAGTSRALASMTHRPVPLLSAGADGRPAAGRIGAPDFPAISPSGATSGQRCPPTTQPAGCRSFAAFPPRGAVENRAGAISASRCSTRPTSGRSALVSSGFSSASLKVVLLGATPKFGGPRHLG